MRHVSDAIFSRVFPEKPGKSRCAGSLLGDDLPRLAVGAGEEIQHALSRSARNAASSAVDSRPRIALRCGNRPKRSMTST